MDRLAAEGDRASISRLLQQTESKPGHSGHSGSQLTVQGTSKLLPLTPYAVNVGTALGFTTREGVWQPAAPIASAGVSMP